MSLPRLTVLPAASPAVTQLSQPTPPEATGPRRVRNSHPRFAYRCLSRCRCRCRRNVSNKRHFGLMIGNNAKELTVWKPMGQVSWLNLFIWKGKKKRFSSQTRVFFLKSGHTTFILYFVSYSAIRFWVNFIEYFPFILNKLRSSLSLDVTGALETFWKAYKLSKSVS